MDLPETLSTTTVYSGKLFSVDVTEIRMPNGVVTRREGIRHPGAVAMVPVDADGNVLLVTQYRHSAGRRLLEIPAGTLEPGEPPIDAVARELQEEIGMAPGAIEPIGGIFVAPGYTDEFVHLYICRNLSESRLVGDEDEDIEIERMSRRAALAAIESGELCDAKSVAGILRWALRE
jgi:ADP-ribose pyrophosphatase